MLSVLAVTAGVLLTTLSVKTESTASSVHGDAPVSAYGSGIALLAIALVMSGVLGIIQDRTFAAYKRAGQPAPWQEAMFYLHALALPLFLPSAPALCSQLSLLAAGSPANIPLPEFLAPLLPYPAKAGPPAIAVPAGAVPLVLNLATQLACSAGANALTGSLTAPSVALVLAARKATSLVLSALVFGAEGVESPAMMGVGAALVFVGSTGWARASVQATRQEGQEKVKKE
jgi:UDP-xylose/UDP-N-acetylglucosamine transporter B4